jgi:hypothetical protein
MESDHDLARRLLGQVGTRIAYIDRHRDRWRLYQGDEDGAENVDLYTHPYPLGSQFGLCGVEQYAIEFNEEGRVESVRVTQRYGIEGPIFEPGDFESGRYRIMCTSASASHAPSYFPAPDSILAHDAASLLTVMSDRAASPDQLPFSVQCRTLGRQPCDSDIRTYLGRLRLSDIDDLSRLNCRLAETAEPLVCFTATAGEHRLGPFPKYITIRGSTHMNAVRVDSVEILESFTMS